MAKIGEYRKKVYELLFQYPLCNYVIDSDEKKKCNVLILGNGWAGNEVIKAAFWAGQSISTQLNITVASENALDYKEHIFSCEKGSPLPALKEFAVDKHYARFEFVNIEVSQDINKSCLEAIDFENSKFTYIVIALGNAESNWLVGSEIMSLIKRSTSEISDRKVAVNIFNEFSTELGYEDFIPLIEEGKENRIEVHFWGTESSDCELERLAQNINFSYEMKYDQRVSKKRANERFRDSYQKEFLDTPHEYEAGNNSIVRNFIGSQYTADSSYASAVHIPVKLALCKQYEQNKDPIETLKIAMSKKNELYWELVALEHRRWNAYTVMRGFRAPTQEEEETVLYHNGNTHQDKEKLLHICLCDCGTKSILNNDFDAQYKMWMDKKCPNDYPSELDRASLRVHQLTDKLSRKIDIQEILDSIVGNQTEYVNLRAAVRKLYNDEDNSVNLYKRCLKDALAVVSEIPEEIRKLNLVRRILEPVLIRNMRMNFFSLDEQLIELIPFVTWYGKRNGTIITISDGMSTATQDVIVPTLLCAENAIFIGKAVGSKKYQKIVKKYFEKRGNNINPIFIQVCSDENDFLFQQVVKQIEKYGVDNIVVNCVLNKKIEVSLAVGRLIEHYSKKINVVQYNPIKGIISYSGNNKIGVGLNSKSYSVEEYIQLLGGKIDNEYSSLYDSDQYEKLCLLFQKYCVPTIYEKKEGKGKSTFNTWACVIGLFNQTSKDIELESIMNYENECDRIYYSGTFSKDIFDKAFIEYTLVNLQTYHIIDNCAVRKEKENVKISFETTNLELVDLIHSFEKDTITDEDRNKSVKFVPLYGGLKIVDRYVKGIRILKEGESDVHKQIKKEFLSDLSNDGFITNLKYLDDDTVSFVYKDEATMHILKTQGAIFELVVYHLIKQLGVYDDVQTGVKIIWNEDDIPIEQQLLNFIIDNQSERPSYRKYIEARDNVIRKVGFASGQPTIRNEIDIVAIKGMDATMVSCKTSDKDNMQWIYEINAVSERFHSKGMLAVSTDYSRKEKSTFYERAKQMGVYLLGTNVLWHKKNLKNDIL